MEVFVWNNRMIRLFLALVPVAAALGAENKHDAPSKRVKVLNFKDLSSKNIFNIPFDFQNFSIIENMLFLNEVEECHSNYPKVDDNTFYKHVYCSLKNEEYTTSTGISCNITKPLIKIIQNKLNVFEIFKNITNSNESCWENNFRPKRNSLDSDLLPGVEMIGERPKEVGKRYIYLGPTRFPITTDIHNRLFRVQGELIDPNTLTEDKKRAADENKPTADEKKLAYDEKKPTVDEQKLTPDEKKPADDEKKPKADEKKLTPDEKKLTPDEKKLTPDEKKPTADEKKPTPDEEKPADDEKKQTTNKNKPASVKKKPASNKKKPASHKKKPAAGKKKPAADKKKPAADKKKPASDKKPVADEKKKEHKPKRKVKPIRVSPKKFFHFMKLFKFRKFREHNDGSDFVNTKSIRNINDTEDLFYEIEGNKLFYFRLFEALVKIVARFNKRIVEERSKALMGGENIGVVDIRGENMDGGKEEEKKQMDGEQKIEMQGKGKKEMEEEESTTKPLIFGSVKNSYRKVPPALYYTLSWVDGTKVE